MASKTYTIYYLAYNRKKKIADTDIKEGINNALEGNLRKKGRYKNKLRNYMYV